MLLLSQDKLQQRRAEYPEGTKIKLIYMNDTQAPPSGSEGTVTHVDDMGTIHMKWENGSTLGLIPDVDQFEMI